VLIQSVEVVAEAPYQLDASSSTRFPGNRNDTGWRRQVTEPDINDD